MSKCRWTQTNVKENEYKWIQIIWNWKGHNSGQCSGKMICWVIKTNHKIMYKQRQAEILIKHGCYNRSNKRQQKAYAVIQKCCKARKCLFFVK